MESCRCEHDCWSNFVVFSCVTNAESLKVVKIKETQCCTLAMLRIAASAVATSSFSLACKWRAAIENSTPIQSLLLFQSPTFSNLCQIFVNVGNHLANFSGVVSWTVKVGSKQSRFVPTLWFLRQDTRFDLILHHRCKASVCSSHNTESLECVTFNDGISTCGRASRYSFFGRLSPLAKATIREATWSVMNP